MSTQPAPANIVERDTIDRLDASIKVTGHTDCPMHPARSICRCPVALALLRPNDIKHRKTDYFRHIWEQYILHDNNAFGYDGTQESHHVFTAAAGMTPKHFTREYLRSDICQLMFAPSGRLQVTVQALVDLWVMRTAMWKKRYGDVETTGRRWTNDEYPEMRDKGSFTIPIEKDDKQQPQAPNLPSTIMTAECTIGPPGHRCMVWVAPRGTEPAAQDESVAVKVIDVKLCHPDCGVGSQAVEPAIPEIKRAAATKLSGMQCDQPEHVRKVLREMQEPHARQD